ncbi:MAG: VCBS domain-containing protein, partial [Hoeflea sp.]|nr:VCBS domain-containing protein [Hoeflea sp.]
FDYLAAGETVTLAYQVTLNDNVGQPNSTDTTTISITIIGTNDRPVIAADPVNIVIAEQVGFYGSTVNIGTTGQIAFTDVDLTDGHTASAVYQSAAWSTGLGIPAATLAQIQSAFAASVNAATVNGAGNIDWVFTLQDQYADFLAPGETLTITYQITLTDDSGAANATATKTVTVTITGAEDLPFSTGTVINGTVFESELVPGGTEAVSGTGDDKNVDGGNDDTIFTGNLMSLVDHGGDLHGRFDVEMTALSFSLTSLTSGGLPLHFAVDAATNTLVARAGSAAGPIVFTFTVDAISGDFTFDLQGQIDHTDKLLIGGISIPVGSLANPGDVQAVPEVAGSELAFVGRLPVSNDSVIRVTNDSGS